MAQVVIHGFQLRDAILHNTDLPINTPAGPSGAPGPPGIPALALPRIVVTTNYSANVNIPVILANGTLTITLPAAIGTGSSFFIKNIGTGTVTIDAGVGRTIDGSQTATLLTQYEAIQLVDRAANIWDVF